MTCEKCGGKGWVNYIKDGYEYGDPCECRIREIEERRLEASGLKKLAEEKTLESFKAKEPWQKNIKNRAELFIKNPDRWFFIGGQVGAGKTHLCTAIAYSLLNQGKSLKYMQWRGDVTRLKSCVMDEEYAKQMSKYKTVKVLYIDDLFKGNVTEADINIAFEIINHRYINRLTTIISTEKTLGQLSEIDSAIASRIYEMSDGYQINVSLDNLKNQRFR